MATGMPTTKLAQVTTTLWAASSTVAQGGSATANLLLQKAKYLHLAFTARTVPLAAWTRRMYVFNVDDSYTNRHAVQPMQEAFEAQHHHFSYEANKSRSLPLLSSQQCRGSRCAHPGTTLGLRILRILTAR